MQGFKGGAANGMSDCRIFRCLILFLLLSACGGLVFICQMQFLFYYSCTSPGDLSALAPAPKNRTRSCTRSSPTAPAGH